MLRDDATRPEPDGAGSLIRYHRPVCKDDESPVTTELSEEEAAYAVKVHHRILEAVVLADADDEGKGGFVRPDLAVFALCRAIAAFSIHDHPSAADMRKRADSCRRSILASMRSLAEGGPDVSWLVTREVHDDC